MYILYQAFNNIYMFKEGFDFLVNSMLYAYF